MKKYVKTELILTLILGQSLSACFGNIEEGTGGTKTKTTPTKTTSSSANLNTSEIFGNINKNANNQTELDNIFNALKAEPNKLAEFSKAALNLKPNKLSLKNDFALIYEKLNSNQKKLLRNSLLTAVAETNYFNILKNLTSNLSQYGINPDTDGREELLSALNTWTTNNNISNQDLYNALKNIVEFSNKDQLKDTDIALAKDIANNLAKRVDPKKTGMNVEIVPIMNSINLLIQKLPPALNSKFYNGQPNFFDVVLSYWSGLYSRDRDEVAYFKIIATWFAKGARPTVSNFYQGARLRLIKALRSITPEDEIKQELLVEYYSLGLKYDTAPNAKGGEKLREIRETWDDFFHIDSSERAAMLEAVVKAALQTDNGYTDLLNGMSLWGEIPVDWLSKSYFMVNLVAEKYVRQDAAQRLIYSAKMPKELQALKDKIKKTNMLWNTYIAEAIDILRKANIKEDEINKLLLKD